jgi:Na+/proline symporter
MDMDLILSPLDLIVIGLYLLMMAGIGLWTYKKIKDTGDFFMGGRRFGKILTIAHTFGSGTQTDQPVAVSGACYELGLAGIWYQWLWLFCTPFYWILAPIYRRLRYITIVDFFQERFGSSMAILYLFMALLFFMVNMGTILKGSGTIVAGVIAVDTTVDAARVINISIIIMTVLFVIYGLLGGLVAAAVTDTIQGVLIVVLSFLLLPFAVVKAGGFEAIHQKIASSMFSLIAPHEVTLFFIVMVVINGLIGWVVQPQHIAIGGSGKTEWEARVGMTYGNYIKRFCTSAWAFMGIFGLILYPGLVHENRELVFGMAVRDLLPAGLVGLMVAGMLAGVMSTCDSFMVGGSAILTNNFYQRYINSSPSRRMSLLISRFASIIIVAGGLSFAFWIPSVVEGLKVIWQVTSVIGISYWIGVVWPRANRWGAWASFIVAASIAVFIGDTFRFGMGLPFEWTTAIYLPAGFITNIVVSLLTRPEPEARLENFYALLETPVGKESRLREKGYEIMYEPGADMKPAEKAIEKEVPEKPEQQLILARLFKRTKGFSLKNYKQDLLGFVVALAFVILVIIITIAFANIGA